MSEWKNELLNIRACCQTVVPCSALPLCSHSAHPLSPPILTQRGGTGVPDDYIGVALLAKADTVELIGDVLVNGDRRQ